MSTLLSSRFWLSALALAAGTVAVAPRATADPRAAKAPPARVVKLSVSPGSSTLTGPEARQTLVVNASYSDGMVRDVTGQSSFVSQNARVLKVSRDGLAQPVADGTAKVTARFAGASAAATLTVKDSKKPFVWSFQNHVIPVLSKQGCSMGSCHGAAAGKGGFRLSLRGYDPDTDYTRLIKESGGRRIAKTDPGRSLVLTKPSMAVPHAGGIRLKPGSLEYRVLSEWIAAGCPGPSEKDPRIESLEVFPPQRVMAPKNQERLQVLARFSDGHVEDVTRWARYTSNEEAIAKVDEQGVVTTDGMGETGVAVFYIDKVAFTTVTVPFDSVIPAQKYATVPRSNYVDDLVLQKLAGLRIWPSEVAGDAEYCRRIYLDMIGVLPNPKEVRDFLADQSPDKRQKLVERLMDRPEYVDFWAYKWSDLLRVSRETLTDRGMWSFYQWIRDQVATNRPWNELVYDVVTSTGSNYDDGPSNFYRISRTPEDLAENASQAFLGIRVQCARCHNHPFEKWTQNDYYGMANYFARVGRKNGDAAGDLVIFPQPSGDINHPKLGKPLPPKPYDGEPLDLKATGDRREVLARWLTAPDNAYFARSIVNRVWRHFMGRGLIEPVDDLRATNPASNEPLMGALVKDLVDHKYDLRHLIKTIAASRTYQLASRPNEQNRKDDRHFSRYFVRRLTAEQLLDAVCQVTGVAEKFNGYPAGTRAVQLPDTKVGSYFLDVFGRPPRQITCDCERAQEPNMAQALHLINGPGVNQKISSNDGMVAKLLGAKKSDPEIVEELYLTCFGRLPTDDEKKATLEAVDEAVNPKPAPAAAPAAAPGKNPAPVRKPAAAAAKATARVAEKLVAAAARPAEPAAPASAAPMGEAKPAAAAAPPPAPLTPEQARRQVFEDLMWALINGKEFIFNH